MAVETHLDQLIEFSSNIIAQLANSPEIVALITDNPEPDVDGVDGEKAREHMYDYDYIDETQTSAGAFIMVDVDMTAADSSTIKDLAIYVQVVVSKTYMRLDPKKFKSVKGNRRDNLVRQIDLILNGSRDFGIGKMQIASARTAIVPTSFTSKMLTYRVYDFSKNKKAPK